MSEHDDHLTISEVAERTGLTVHTLRYYESAGLLLTPVRRETSSHRSYTAGDLAWITFLTRLRSTALPIKQVRVYADLARRGDETRGDRLELLQRHRITVAAQLAEMQASLAAIDYKIALYVDALVPNAPSPSAPSPSAPQPSAPQPERTPSA
jgi:DNA-binding transcriptional MerR regulator